MDWLSDNADVGNGSQVVTAYDPPRHVASELDLGRMGKSSASWDLEPSDTGTKATWGFKSRLDGIAARWFGLTLDKKIGADYEKGLAKLKAVAERPDPATDVN
jgi:hypothetical protein